MAAMGGLEFFDSKTINLDYTAVIIKLTLTDYKNISSMLVDFLLISTVVLFLGAIAAYGIRVFNVTFKVRYLLLLSILCFVLSFAFGGWQQFKKGFTDACNDCESTEALRNDQ